jgi:hypothetical protein
MTICPPRSTRKALPMAATQPSLRQQKRDLRARMRTMGLGYQDIAAEFARRYNLRAADEGSYVTNPGLARQVTEQMPRSAWA